MVSHKITDELTKRSAHFGLILDDISIVSDVLDVLLKLQRTGWAKKTGPV